MSVEIIRERMGIEKYYRRFWVYDPNAEIPAWVRREMFWLDDSEDVLTTSILGRLYEARPGDCIVEIGEGVVLPVKAEHFMGWKSA